VTVGRLSYHHPSNSYLGDRLAAPRRTENIDFYPGSRAS